jgi:DNA-directed RNA polymerase specialized sigma24 family protein
VVFGICFAMNRYDGVDERVVMNVKICARNLKRSNLLRSMEIEDIEQELMCEVLECLHKFDEARGDLNHFIRKVLARRSVNLLQSSLCAKRGPFVNFRECNENDSDELSSNRSTELSLLSDYLPSRYKVLCKLLAGHSVTETSKIIGKSRAFVYRDLKRISIPVNQKSNFENQILSMFKK